jgi:aspartyl-tRNA(Asn)/glutamyl-tRNA(Gln) amidotransferase subunit A
MISFRSDVCDLPLTEVASAIERRELSSMEVTASVLSRIDALEPQLHAYITVLAEDALHQATEADRNIAAGRYRGPLHGIPISVKDLFWTAGIRTTGGSPLLRNWVPQTDATVVRRLTEAGAVLVGKTNMYEFAYGSVHPDIGPARNPWDLSRTTGGSSSGSAASVSAGMSYGSVGSDTGGSIRIPAAYCGIVGMKPTYGRVSRYGAIPLSWSCDHMGPMTRTVSDCATMLQTIAGHDPLDSTSIEFAHDNYHRSIEYDVSKLRIGIAESYLRENVTPAVLQHVEQAIHHFETVGASVRSIDLPPPSDVVPLLLVIMSAEAATYHLPTLRTQPDVFSDAVRERLEVGAITPATTYIHAQRVRTQVIERMRIAMSDVDVVLMPTSPMTAPLIDGDLSTSGDADPGLLAARINYTGPFDLTGFPALSMPCGFAEPGLPVGMQLVAKPFEESVLLSAAWAYEQSTDWHHRLPPAVAGG